MRGREMGGSWTGATGAALGLALALTMGSAQAGLIGDQVDVRYHYQSGATSIDTQDIVTASAAVELSCPSAASICSLLTASTQSIDLQDSKIRYTYASTTGQSAGFDNVDVNGFDFRSLDLGADIVGVQLSTDIAGLLASRISFDAHSVQVDMRGLPVGFGAFFELSLLTDTGSLPLPGVPALLALGLAGLAWQRRVR